MSEKRGRKPAPGMLVPVLPVSNRKLEAERALAFFVDVMYNRDLPLATRIGAAREVLDRVEGRPAQAVTVRDWRSNLIELIKAGKLTADAVKQELGSDLATELFIAAGLPISES